MNDLETTPQVQEGLAPEQGASQESVQPEQSAAQTQNGTSASVESGDGKNQANGEVRPPSEFYTGRKLSKLERQIQTLTEIVQSSLNKTSASPRVPQQLVTNEELVKNPAEIIQKMIRAELDGFRAEMPQHLQQLTAAERKERASQDAFQMIKTNDVVKNDPEWESRVKDILLEEDENGNSLEEYSKLRPKHAAQLVIQEYRNRHGGLRRSQAAPSKAQMQTTATAVNAGAGKSTTNQEAEQLQKQIFTNPELLKDPEFMKKLAVFTRKAELESLAKS